MVQDVTPARRREPSPQYHTGKKGRAAALMLSYRERVGGTAMRGEKPYVYRYSTIRDEPEAPEEQQARQLDEAQRKIAALENRVQVLERTNKAAVVLLTQANGGKAR